MTRCTVTICMPYYERMERLETSLMSFKEQGYFSTDYPASVAVIVIDDGSMREPLDKSWNDKITSVGIPIYVARLPPKAEWKCSTEPMNAAVFIAQSEYISSISTGDFAP